MERRLRLLHLKEVAQWHPFSFNPTSAEFSPESFVRFRLPKELTRAQALLWLDEGESVEEVAQRLLVSRQTVYNWLLRFHQRSGQDIRSRLQDAPRQGRPPTALGIIDPLLEEVIDTDSRTHGYRHTVWTAGLLQHYLHKTHGMSVCRKSISLALARLGIRWKRPRHVLGQRPDTWRQAKGG